MSFPEVFILFSKKNMFVKINFSRYVCQRAFGSLCVLSNYMEHPFKYFNLNLISNYLFGQQQILKRILKKLK